MCVQRHWSVPMLLFKQKHRLCHPENCLFCYYLQKYFLDQSIRKKFYLILKTEALVHACREETQCRFCRKVLPDWRCHLGAEESVEACPTMSVEYQGKVVFIKLRSGQRANRGAVEHLIKQLFGIPDSQELNLSFECLVPDSGVASTESFLFLLNQTFLGYYDPKNVYFK